MKRKCLWKLLGPPQLAKNGFVLGRDAPEARRGEFRFLQHRGEEFHLSSEKILGLQVEQPLFAEHVSHHGARIGFFRILGALRGRRGRWELRQVVRKGRRSGGRLGEIEGLLLGRKLSRCGGRCADVFDPLLFRFQRHRFQFGSLDGRPIVHGLKNNCLYQKKWFI